MNTFEILGLVGIVLNLAGAILVIDKVVTFKSFIKRLEDVGARNVAKYFRKISLNIFSEYINRNQNAKDIELVRSLQDKIKNGDYPNIEELKQLSHDRKKVLGDRPAKKRRETSNSKNLNLLTELKRSVMLRILFFNNPYFIPLVVVYSFKFLFSKIVKYQLQIGASFFVLGHVFQIIEKIGGK